MAKKDLDAFYKKVEGDASLQARLVQAKDETAFVEAAVELGQASGYSFTQDEVRDMIQGPRSNRQLTDQELETVAAGGISFGDSILCGYCGKQSGTCANSLWKAPR